jgi:nucleoside-diphosphate-sugar epimerase
MIDGRTIAVTGATGYVGRFVVGELQRQGVAVRGLVRPGSDCSGFDSAVDWVIGDLRTPDAFPSLVEGVDAVVHLAYEHVSGRYRGGEGDDLVGWLESNVGGTLRLLETSHEAGVPQFIFLSSRAVFSRTDPGRVLDEFHPISPDTHYGAYKAAVEAFLQSFAHQYGMATTAVRATGVYGLTHPLERTKWWSLITAVLNGEEHFTNGGGTEVHGQDVAGVIWALLERPTQAIPVIHLSDRYVTHRQVVELARRFSGLPGSLPDAPPAPPDNPLACCRIAELGLAFGGLPLLKSTVAALVDQAMAGD